MHNIQIQNEEIRIFVKDIIGVQALRALRAEIYFSKYFTMVEENVQFKNRTRMKDFGYKSSFNASHITRTFSIWKEAFN